MVKNNARIENIEPIIAAGINPKTGLPYRLGSDKKCFLKDEIKKTLRVLDEQNAVNRYEWNGLPNGLDGQLLERILYYKGQAMFFYMPADGKYYFLPYALDGSIDVYGRFRGVTPLPFNGTAETKKDAWITGLTRIPVYDIESEDVEKDPELVCVLLSDYTKQISQTVISRQLLQDPILDAMAEAFPLARTSLIANSGVRGVRVNSEDEASQVQLAAGAITTAAMSGEAMVPMIGNQDFQDLTSGGKVTADQYLLYMQSLDNYRLSLYGLDAGGIFEKKAQMLQSEQGMNSNNTGLVYEDGLTIRERFCEFVNDIFGLNISVKKPEEVNNDDKEGIEIENEEFNDDSMEGGE